MSMISRWDDFARLTVQTGDLDPMYDMMAKARQIKGDRWINRYALHFFMFYDAGGAARCANDDTPFWSYVTNGYHLFRRGTERRHFRGDNGKTAVVSIQLKGEPEAVWSRMSAPTYTNLLANINQNFQQCQIGPYFAWKAMDILDRCLGFPVILTRAEAVKGIPDQPKECAKAVFPHLSLGDALDTVVDAIKDLPAPGVDNRNCGYSEAETVLCMLKGYFITKTHTIGDDVDEKHEQMKDFPDLCELLPTKQNWSKYERGPLDTTSLPA
jgi:hypothetical protein